MSENASPSDLVDEPEGDTDAEVSNAESTGGLDVDRLDEAGADVAVGLIAAAVGSAAWSLPSGWLIAATFLLGGVGVMFAEDWRVRAVGPLIVSGGLVVFAPKFVAVTVAAVVAGLVATLYHHRVVDLSEVI